MGGEQYRFTSAVAELTGATAIIRDVAWSPLLYRDRDLVATASADGFVRIYEVEVPKTVTEEIKHVGPSNRKSTNIPSGIGAGLAGNDSKTSDSEDSGIPHRWSEVAELKHDECWRVEWMKDGGVV